ncbi:hypothetical protein PRK78_001340 [Emydomyces testavorans]|uniref:AhpC/TSA antioxidant enzyme-domain-containing protein n=1 Tax=Emydomyces testavorans TaxID=2070801 RepID=A0AAF0DCQ8_9EURO|nr:hypothetical protein PRK78_001340 [Emydomyces testavorans]
MDKPLPSPPSDGRLAVQAQASGSSTHVASEENVRRNTELSDTLPSQNDIEQAFRIPILNSDGKERLFGDLFDVPKTLESSKLMVVFVRHFFCGSCQDYIQTLSCSIPSTSLPQGTSLVIIGCGATSLIPMYAKVTSCPFPIYTDPTSRLYSIFGMTRTWSLGPAPEYLRHSTFSLVVKGISQGLKRTFNGDALKSGDMAQVGGEFLFETKSKNQEEKQDASKTSAIWCHRMKTTRDHTEARVLKRVMGLE